jgi:hypothetical protein
MHRITRLRPTPALVVATIALLVALGGVGYAATSLPPNSVGTAQVIDHSLLRQDFKAGQLPRGAKGARGPQGPAGAQGAQGPKGDPGPPATKMWARIDATGRIIAASDIAAVYSAGAGFWNVMWNQPVNGCAVSVTPENTVLFDASAYNSPNDEVLVRTFDINTKAAKAVPFDIEVFC